ncbi:MAG: hypothetical protein ABI811_15475 [Acidobacteriota bacterium]
MAAPEPSKSERQTKGREFLAKRLTVWQARPQLKDWKISLDTAGQEGLRAGTIGNIHWDADAKTVRIRVLDAAGYQRPFKAALEDNEDSRNDEEYAVNRMAEALLQLDARK